MEESLACIMRGRLYNIHGFGQSGRRGQIREFIAKERLDFIGLQETIKPAFTPSELSSIDPEGRFAWHSSPANGHSGGMLMKVNEDTLVDVLA